MSRLRYLTDPLYHAAVEVVTRTALEAVREADDHPDPDLPQWEGRFRAIVAALVDGPPDPQAVVDVGMALLPLPEVAREAAEAAAAVVGRKARPS